MFVLFSFMVDLITHKLSVMMLSRVFFFLDIDYSETESSLFPMFATFPFLCDEAYNKHEELNLPYTDTI